MKRYHGTTAKSAGPISTGKIDVTKGGGELGQGFYVGSLAYVACARAWNTCKRYASDKPAVVEFDIDDKKFDALNPKIMNRKQAKAKWDTLIRKHKCKTYSFNRNAVCAPLLGGHFTNCQQIKFESKCGETFINHTKKIIL